MKILSLQPAARIGGGSMALLASFDIQLTPEIAIYGMRLLRAPDGRLLTYAPSAPGGRRVVTFSPRLTTEITQAAASYFQEHVTAHDSSNRNAA